LRYISTIHLKEGMVLGKSLTGVDGALLLRQGQIIHNSYIKKIKALGFNGVYISDEISNDIYIDDVVSEDVRIKAVNAVKNIFVSQEKLDSREFTKNVDKTKMLVENIVEQIFKNKRLMVNMVDLKIFDEYTFFHSVNVSVLSVAIGTQMNFNREELYKLGLGGVLHDVGKVFISKEILDKTSKLTEDEFDRIKEHSALGYDYLRRKFDIPKECSLGVLQHHEKYDGTGYPDKIKSDSISLYGKIISVADVYDALTSDRPYRKAMLPSEAMEYIMGGSGTLFDPDVAFSFTRKVAVFPVGICVKLSDGRNAIVVENYPDCSIRPRLKIIDSIKKKTEYIDLKNDVGAKNITIVEIINM
jgi:HD-GYP domain-containing protein (c-di-GMP phosphodiesterase class II)